jgi:predicted Zn-dependent protease
VWQLGEIGMLDAIEARFAEVCPKVDFCSLRYVRQRDEVVAVRQDVPQPVVRSDDAGAMVAVVHSGGMGYAATGDLSTAGLRRAAKRAAEWAACTAGRNVVDFASVAFPHPVGEYSGPDEQGWERTSLAEKFDLLLALSRRMKVADRIVDWEASLWHTAAETMYLTSGGGRAVQRFSYMAPHMRAAANEGSDTQTRTLNGERGTCRQGGLEVLEQVGFREAPQRVAEEALELLAAPNCPDGRMDVVLAPDQMMLQIHESIGHPLELDRVLGDERNYAGTSFVTLDMFGTYRYGTELLNVTYDPTRGEQFASFAYDDDGMAAEKAHVIEKGILKRPLGGLVSQARAGLPGVANARACSWNRPPIDRMANLNLEAGSSRLDEMIAAVERGVYMKTNRSWSIDDSRNKFQFGCEWGRLIEDGRLVGVVKNPNYRGISATFWRSLMMVGDASAVGVYGTPYCGKGEPNQCVRVGHASPACLFAGVDVFGGEA